MVAALAVTLFAPSPAGGEGGAQPGSDDPPIHTVTEPQPDSELLFSLSDDPSREEIKVTLSLAARTLGLEEARMLRIAACESGYNYRAQNKHSSARGIFQFLSSTWAVAAREVGIDPDSFRGDPSAQIIVGMKYIQNHGYGAWECK
ncbi:MAG: transglycosylase family protein [Candidatus Eisenbacteria bacterium]|nr:transglycosylase family protein [Candidatus Eisenbacteria bacterium]